MKLTLLDNDLSTSTKVSQWSLEAAENHRLRSSHAQNAENAEKCERNRHKMCATKADFRLSYQITEVFRLNVT